MRRHTQNETADNIFQEIEKLLKIATKYGIEILLTETTRKIVARRFNSKPVTVSYSGCQLT